MKYIKKLTHQLIVWIQSFIKTKYATFVLFAVSFIDSSFVTIPTDFVFVPLLASDTKKWIKYTSIVIISSVLGTMFAYYIASIFLDSIGEKTIHFYHLQETVKIAATYYNRNAFLTVFLFSFIPFFPYKTIIICAGLLKVSIFPIFLAALLGRSIRFIFIATIIVTQKDKASVILKKYLKPLNNNVKDKNT